MTDPRIEAAARALCELAGYRPDGDEVTPKNYPAMDVNWKVYEDDALVAIEAADEAAWRHVSIPPRSTEWVNIVSHQGGEVNYAVAQWDYTVGYWRNPELGMRYSPFCFTRWQPLPAPPNIEASAAPETITIPQVRNDRPIPAKGESHS